VGDFAAKVHAITGTSDAEYTIRQAAYALWAVAVAMGLRRGEALATWPDQPALNRRPI
jgi:hypothetical protein